MCPCRVRFPYDSTWDLERDLGAELEAAGPDRIRCRHCGRAWLAMPLPGGIYGDTLWREVEPGDA